MFDFSQNITERFNSSQTREAVEQIRAFKDGIEEIEKEADRKQVTQTLVDLLRMKESAARLLLDKMREECNTLKHGGVSSVSLARICEAYNLEIDTIATQLCYVAGKVATLTHSHDTGEAYQNITSKIMDEACTILEELNNKPTSPEGFIFAEIYEAWHNYHNK